MDLPDKPEFARLMTYLAEAFNEHMTPARMAVYFEALSGYELWYVQKAARQAVKTCRFFPKVVELSEISAHFRRQHQASIRDEQRALVAKPEASDDTETCCEVDNGLVCGKTVRQHRDELRALVERIAARSRNSP